MGASLAVTFVQRFSSALRLHFHSLIPDGVIAAARAEEAPRSTLSKSASGGCSATR
jgi:hypothetical protein